MPPSRAELLPPTRTTRPPTLGRYACWPCGSCRLEGPALCRHELIPGHSWATRLCVSRILWEERGGLSGPGKGKKADTAWVRVLLEGGTLQARAGRVSACFSAKGFSWEKPTSACLSPSAALGNGQKTFLVPSTPLVPHDTISGPRTLPWVKLPLGMWDLVQQVHPLPFSRRSTFDNVVSGGPSELLSPLEAPTETTATSTPECPPEAPKE